MSGSTPFRRRDWEAWEAEQLAAEARQQAYQRAYKQRPEVKAKQRAYQQRPEVKAKQRAYKQRPEVKAKQRAYQRAYGQELRRLAKLARTLGLDQTGDSNGRVDETRPSATAAQEEVLR